MAPNIAGHMTLTVTGNFVDIGEQDYDAYLAFGSNEITNRSKQTNMISFTVPQSAFSFALDKVGYVGASITIPYKVSEVLGLIHRKEFATFDIIIIVLPPSPGTDDTSNIEIG